MQDPTPEITHTDIPHVRPISKALYIWSIVGSILLGWALVIPGYVLMLSARDDATAIIGSLLACSAWIPMVYGIVMAAILIYRMWQALQGGEPRATPGKAVGFLFIPFYNLYWIFQAYYGWAVDYNRFVQQAGIRAPRANERLAMTVCVLSICCIVPFLGFFIAVINLVLFIVFFSNAIDGINAIAAGLQAQSQDSLVSESVGAMSRKPSGFERSIDGPPLAAQPSESGSTAPIHGAERKTTPLHEAVMTDDYQRVMHLLGSGCTVDAKDGDGRTALHLAAMLNRVYIAEGLLDAGASLDMPDDENRTAFQIAEDLGQHDVISVFVRRSL